MNVLLSAVCVFTLMGTTRGHGRLIDPPSRSTIWRYTYLPLIAPYKSIVETNYQDNELFCGGFNHQRNLGGKCGVCGDPWDEVRENEAGEKYGKGIIVKQYPAGTMIHVYVEITAHHKGYFEFRLCVWNNQKIAINQDCLDANVLNIGVSGGTKWYLPTAANYGEAHFYEVPLELPNDIECDQCVLQWKYHTGNSWGCDDSECCVGCGPQEEFYGCADISIGNGSIIPPPDFGPTIESTTKSTTVITNPVSTSMSSTVETVKSTTLATSTMTASTLSSPMETEICQSYDAGLKAGVDCEYFYMCSNGIAYEFKCAPGTVFNPENEVCDRPFNVLPPCGIKGI